MATRIHNVGTCIHRPFLAHLSITSVVRCQHLPCGHSISHFCSIDLKLGQNVCLDKILNKLEFESLGVKKLGH